jgi:hypothetical protein
MDAEKALVEMDEACPSCYGAMRMHSAVPGSTLSEPCPHRIHSRARTLARAAFEAGKQYAWDSDDAAGDGRKNPPLPKWLTETSR